MTYLEAKVLQETLQLMVKKGVRVRLLGTDKSYEVHVETGSLKVPDYSIKLMSASVFRKVGVE